MKKTKEKKIINYSFQRCDLALVELMVLKEMFLVKKKKI